MKIRVATLLLLLIATQVLANQNFEQLLNSYETISQIELGLKELEFIRRDELIEFLKPITGNAYVDSNELLLKRIAIKSSLPNQLNQILEPYVADKKERRKLISKLSLSQVNHQPVMQLNHSLKNMVNALRGPINEGYKYARFSREQGRSVEKQKLVAQHEIGNFQAYNKTFETGIYRVHIYSPTKLDLFSKNRDVYLKNLRISYHSDGKKKEVNQDYNRLLKRGESLDYNLPEIAFNPTIVLTFATKKQHKGKAIFFVEPIEAGLVDDPGSPHIRLINSILESPLNSSSVEKLQNTLTLLKASLRTSLMHESAEKNDFEASAATNPGKIGLVSDNDNLKYFSYLLKDMSISRETLIEKFENLIK